MSDETKTFLGVHIKREENAADPSEVRARHQANRSAWNEGAARYSEGLEEAIASLAAGESNLHPLERANLGDLGAWCQLAIHLQCASGKDTLSLWKEGVREVVGIDISDTHIANARRMAQALGAPARFYRCDVLDAPAELDGTADLVYTGRGALFWLHDLESWAAVVSRLLKPGGVFHLLDDHPLTWLFDQNAETLRPTGFSYFSHSESSQGWPSSYIGPLDKPVEEEAIKYERAWPLSAVFTALVAAGLTVERFGEHPDEYWDAFPNLPRELKSQLPMTFTMMARKG